IVNHYCNLVSPGFQLDFDILKRYLTRPLKRAEELGVTLVLENEAHDVTHRPENVWKIVDYFRSTHFRTNFDVTNYYQASNEAFPYAYEIVKDIIGYVHIKNGRITDYKIDALSPWLGGKMSGFNDRHHIVYTPPTAGAVNVIGLLDRLKQD